MIGPFFIYILNAQCFCIFLFLMFFCMFFLLTEMVFICEIQYFIWYDWPFMINSFFLQGCSDWFSNYYYTKKYIYFMIIHMSMCSSYNPVRVHTDLRSLFMAETVLYTLIWYILIFYISAESMRMYLYI